MKVLITGGAGFIGSNLADRLLERGDNICVIDNYATGRRDNLTPREDLTIIEGDISDAVTVGKAFKKFKPDMVVHAAASYKDPSAWEEDARTNVVGTAVVIKAAEQAGVKRLIYFQTSLCYGLNPVEQPISLSHPIMLEGSSYAISKTAGERYIALSNLDFISFRLANAYGPRNLSGPLPTFYHRITNGKGCFVINTRRDFIFIDDLLSVVMMALDGKGERGYYHVASGRDYSIKELYDAVVDSIGAPPLKQVEELERKPDDVYSILLDPSKTLDDFGWETRVPLSEGVNKAVAYYKEYGVEQTFTHLKIED